MPPIFTPKYAMNEENGKYRFTFFCELSGESYTTPAIAADSIEKALELARNDARPHFNRCMRCQRWICDAAYNEDEMMCLSCAPKINRTPVSNTPVNTGRCFSSAFGKKDRLKYRQRKNKKF